MAAIETVNSKLDNISDQLAAQMDTVVGAAERIDKLAAVSETTQPPATWADTCLLYTSPSPRDRQKSRMPSSA